MQEINWAQKAKIIFYFVRPYPALLFSLVFLVLISASTEAASLAVLYSLFQSAFQVPAGGGEILTHSILLIGRLFRITDPLVVSCIMLILLTGLKDGFNYAIQVLSVYIGVSVNRDNQSSLLQRYMGADYQVFLDARQGEILFRIINAPDQIRTVLTLVPQIFTELVKVIIIASVLLTLAFKISVTLLVFGFCYYLFTRYIATNVSYYIGTGRTQSVERQIVLVSEMTSGIRQIKLYRAEKHWIGEFFGAMNKYFNLFIKDGYWSALPKNLLDFVFISGLAIILIVVKNNDSAGFIRILPDLGVIAYAFMRLMPSMGAISSNWIALMGSLPAAEILYDALHQKMNDIQDGKLELGQFQHAIRFEDITFSYSNKQTVLRNLSMQLPRGKRTAIVGASGVGKTTIVDLITRLFRPDSGKITVDGIDLREIAIESWLAQIGYVSQDTFIFNATIAENIAMGDETVTMEAIIQAAKDANAHDFILNSADGYNTVVGDRGMKISGGQRQRLAIARALLRKPNVLILDEATSALDNISEVQVQEAIDNISKERTVIVIAHRLSTVVNADNIIVLDSGGVAEQGTHEELLARNGIYKSLYNSQTT